MGVPKINLASLQCPRCAGITKLNGVTRANNAGSERFSFVCSDCGAFEVLAITEPEGEFPAERPVRRERELQDLWA
ncbi:MAG TPA: hypothetical protein VNR41_12175 [Xanthobacteraceae bacterium]|nr:hypothetical protein [Xanthobacteraceae bacterium]